jgi:hypothetical protein
MKKKVTTMNTATNLITRRDALRIGAGAVAGAVISSVATALAEETIPKASRIHEYSWVRGFNYQPSWGSHGITIWNDFREATYAKELDLGLKHFPKINTLRIWFSFDAYVADPKRFLAAAKRASELLSERKLKMIPVFFNGWHSTVDFGGFSGEALASSSRQNFAAQRQYVGELLEAIRPAGNLLMCDISNEPFNNGGKDNKGSIQVKFLEAMAQQIRELDSRTPISVGTQGCPGVGGPKDLELIDSFVDVHAVHPYWVPSMVSVEEHVQNFAKMVAILERLGKPAIATECCWGSNNDEKRVQYIRHDLGLLKQAGIGFLPHALHHSPVADLHRPVPGRKWKTMYMAFIEPDGSIRPGHEVFNELCS